MTTPTPPPPPTPPAANTGATTPPPQPSFVPLPDDAPVVPNAGAAVPGGGAGASTMALAAIGAVVIVGVAIIGGLAIFGGSDGATTDQLAVPTTIALRETVVESTIVPAPTTVDVGAAAAPAPETTVTPEATVAPNTTTAPTTTSAPATTVPAPPAVAVPDSSPSNPNVEESKAVVRNGQIFLTGAVPNAQAGLEIEALAAEILGPQNVFNDYVIDPAAGDPNLGNITVEDTITFASASALLDASSEGLLNQGLALLNIRPAMTITIVGHTDDIGSEQNNLKLSQDRAESVKQWFVDRGIDSNRLAALGRGESEPIADNATPDGRRQNRRIQFFLENILGG